MGDQEPEPDKLPNLMQPPQQLARLAELYQMHVGLERVRAPEVLFQPSLIGEDSAGLAETLAFVLSRFSSEDQHALAQNVIVTGGNAQYPGLCERLQREMVATRPFNSTFSVRVASEPALSAWLGARDWAVAHAVCGERGGGGGERGGGGGGERGGGGGGERGGGGGGERGGGGGERGGGGGERGGGGGERGGGGGEGWMTRADYAEKGSDYLVEHSASNVYVKPARPAAAAAALT
uniref:Actin-related protein 5-like n=1 Tax=Petromyzon marinus TaxID=7757 RepID=A0AAJ7UES5_PETMA|nr:actin-related protein 5-like [Petromyzon marinus]